MGRARMSGVAPPLVAVVDDDPVFLELMTALIAERGWRSLGVAGEQGALERLREVLPDMVVVDLRMERPDSGWQLLEGMRSDDELARVPVVVCSAAASDLASRGPWLEERRIPALAKPFELDDLYRVLDECLGRAPAGRRGG